MVEQFEIVSATRTRSLEACFYVLKKYGENLGFIMIGKLVLGQVVMNSILLIQNEKNLYAE